MNALILILSIPVAVWGLYTSIRTIIDSRKIKARPLEELLKDDEFVDEYVKNEAVKHAGELYAMMVTLKLKSHIKATVDIRGELYQLTFTKITE